MDVRNCKKCGNLFDYTGNPVCPACEKQMEEKFLEVRQYIYDHPGASMPTVAEDMDIPIQQIKKWIRQERLCFTKDSGVSIDCEKWYLLLISHLPELSLLLLHLLLLQLTLLLCLYSLSSSP